MDGEGGEEAALEPEEGPAPKEAHSALLVSVLGQGLMPKVHPLLMVPVLGQGLGRFWSLEEGEGQP